MTAAAQFTWSSLCRTALVSAGRPGADVDADDAGDVAPALDVAVGHQPGLGPAPRPRSGVDGLELLVGADGVRPEFAADAAGLDAAEWHRRVGGVAVDADGAGANPARDRLAAFRVGCPDAAAE